MNKNDSMLSSYLAALHAEYNIQNQKSSDQTNGDNSESAKASAGSEKIEPPVFASAPETVDAQSSGFDLLDPDLDTDAESPFTLTVAEKKPVDKGFADIDLAASIDAAFADLADEDENGKEETEEPAEYTEAAEALPEETNLPAEIEKYFGEEAEEQTQGAEESASEAEDAIPSETGNSPAEEDTHEAAGDYTDEPADNEQEELPAEPDSFETEAEENDNQPTEPDGDSDGEYVPYMPGENTAENETGYSADYGDEYITESEADDDDVKVAASTVTGEEIDYSVQADEPIYFRKLPGIAETEDKTFGDVFALKTEKIVVEEADPTRKIEIKTKPKEGMEEHDGLVVSVTQGEVSEHSDRIKIYSPDSAPESDYMRVGKKPVVNAGPESEDQITFADYNDSVTTDKISNEDLENDLIENRRRIAEKFTIHSTEEESGNVVKEKPAGTVKEPIFTKIRKLLFPYVSTNLRLNKPDVEYISHDKFNEVLTDRKSREMGTLVCSVLTAIFTLVLMITVGSSSVAEKIGYTQSSGLPKSYIISLIFIILSFAFGFIVMSDGMPKFGKHMGKINAKTPLLVAGAVAILQNILSMILWNGTKTLVVLYTPAASLAMFLGCIGCLLSYYDTEKNLHFLRRREHYTIHTVKAATAQTDAAHPRSDGIVNMPHTICSGKTDFADKFVAYSTSDNSMDDLSSKLLIIALAFAFVIAVFAGIKNKSFSSALSIFSGALCMGIPAGALIAINLPLTLINNHLRQDGAMITSYAAAYETEDKKEVLVDAAGLFPERSYTFDDVRSFGNVSTAEAVRIAATILNHYDTPLGRFFKHKVMKDSGLNKIADVVYEDKQGLTGWIENRKICLGNSELMSNHNVLIPIDAREEDLTKDGQKVLYLSDNEALIAVFILTYRPGERIGEYLKKITERGMSIAVCTCDPNITEEFIASAYHISLNSVRVVLSTEALVINEFINTPTEKEDAKIIHNGNPVAYLRSINSAGMLCSISRFTGYSQLFFCLIFLLVTLILTFVGNIMSSGVVIFCSIIGTLLCSVIGFITKD